MIDWNDNAQDAIEEYREWMLKNGKKIDIFLHQAFLGEIVEQRASQTQTKTVADAVEQERHWSHDRLTFLAWNSITNKFVYGSSKKCAPHEQYVCTREQFEAYVKEREGKKWTHVCGGDICKIVHQVDGEAWIKFKPLLDSIVISVDELKPIKPTISDKQVASIIEAAAAWGVSPDDCQDYLSKFTVEGSEGECDF